jgi:hypothetical protein
MEALLMVVSIKILKDQETELKQGIYAKYSHIKTKLHRRGLNPEPCHCVLTATAMTYIWYGIDLQSHSKCASSFPHLVLPAN